MSYPSEPPEGDSVYVGFIAEHGYGVHHFGVLVVDMPAALDKTEAAAFT